MSEEQNARSHGLLSTFKSVMAAFFGVQSDQNRQKDFSSGKFSQFVAMGVVATLLFVFLVWAAVQLALSAA